MFLSIIIPAYNEERRILKTMESIDSFLLSKPFSVEVIIVDNRSNDNTYKIANQFAITHPQFRVVQEQIRGKGAAVRKGMLLANGEWRFMCDADLSMPIEEISKFIPDSFFGDIAIGSRELPASKRISEPKRRHFTGRVFNCLTRMLLLPNISDTQCGFKCFKGDIAEVLFKQQTVYGWAFDVEILSIAKFKKYEIVEIPITWIYSESSKINIVKDSIEMFTQVIRIYRNKKNLD